MNTFLIIATAMLISLDIIMTIMIILMVKEIWFDK